MNLAQLEYLEAACREGCLTDVARSLHVTQQAVSASIAALEKELGVQLLVRSRGGVRPTPECEELLSDVRAANDAIARIRLRAAELRGDLDGTVAFAYATCTLRVSGTHPNQHDLAEFCNRHPGVSLRTFEAASDACLALVQHGTADLALVAGRPDTREFGGTFLHAPELALCVPVDHPLASRDGQVSYADLRETPQLLPPDLNYSLRLTNEACERWGFSPTYLEMPQASRSQVDLVASGHAVAFMPEHFEEARQDDRVRLVHMRPDEACHVPLWLVWSMEHPLAPATKAFADYFENLMRQSA